MTRQRFILALTLAAVTAASGTILRAQPNQPPAQRLEGSWAITVTPAPPPGAPPLPDRYVYATFARGGGAIGSDRGLPFSSPQHGVWEHLGGNEFAYTFIQDLFDAAGSFQGTLQVKQRIILTSDDEFVGVANPQIRDAAGNLTLDACSTFKAERLTTGPLAPRCQSLSPPQP